MVVPLLIFTLCKNHCLILGRRTCFSLAQFFSLFWFALLLLVFFPRPLQCWNIVLKQLCGLWVLIPSFSFFCHVEASCWASSKQIFLNQTKKRGLWHGTGFGCEIRVKVTCTHPVPAAVSLGLPKCWASLAELMSQQQIMFRTLLDGKLSCQSPLPFKLSKQAFYPSFLKESCWSKHLSFLFIWIADPFACWLRCGLNTTVDALLKHERTMHLFRFSGICQKYLIALKCWDVISIT